MTRPDSEPAPGSLAAPAFATTHWSVVLAASEVDRARAEQALNQLCRTYWQPLYVFARQLGRSREDAEDLTQSFIASLLARGDIARANPARGRFRSFLLAAFKHFVFNQSRRAQQLKRGGGAEHLRLDTAHIEARLELAAKPNTPADAVFDREWALTLLDSVIARLRAEQQAAGRPKEFDALLPALVDGTLPASQADMASELGTTEAALRMALHRLRRRYLTLLRAEVAETLDDPSEIDAELRHLIAALNP